MQIWGIRDARQREFWKKENSTDINIIIHEAALYFRVGEDETMMKQISKLRDFAVTYSTRVILQILPFDLGVPKGMHRGFTMFNTRNPYLDDLVYIEDSREMMIHFQEKPRQFDEYENTFWKLWDLANSRLEDGSQTRDHFIEHLERINRQRFGRAILAD
ncbi:hypothetical protein GCM10022223_42970 [Kineosporia mesophila]|uniref:DUF5753 domain-containing protein n=2 Tax=Kineosporia mesophila TaxID=566012 RepID=A0ABP6ZZ38_9ACTN